MHCDCGDDHGHNHHDHHEHDHHSGAEAFAESALKKSARRAVALDAPASARDIAERKLSVLSEIAGLLAYEDIILGHIKALIDFGDEKAAISITRLDECSQSFDHLGSLEVLGYTITVNVLSLHNTETRLDGLFEKLFSEC